MTYIARHGPNGRPGTSVARLSVVVCLWSGANLLGAAQVDEEAGVLRVGTQLVQVNVVVTGDEGPIRDLTVDDFTVLDDGVERRIEVFDVIRSATDDADPAAMLSDGIVSNRLDRRGQRPESVTAILIDRVNTQVIDQPFMDDQVREFLDDASATGEHVTVLELGEEGLTVLADFTAHPVAVRDALQSRRPSHSLALESSRDFVTGEMDPVRAGTEGFPHANDYIRSSLEFFWGRDPMSAMTAARSPFRLYADVLSRQIEAYYMERRVVLTVAALEATARHLSEFPGRKNLVWLSARFPFPFRPWQDPRLNFAAASGWPHSTLDRIDEAFRRIVDSDVAVYPIDALGLPARSDATIGIQMEIAEITGGRVSFNTNGPAARMHQAARDTSTNYSLGFYVPEVESDAEFHELEVRVDRDGVDVLHRSGYFGFGADAPGSGDLDRTLQDPFNAMGIGLLATAEPVPAAPGLYTVTLAIDVNDIDLIREADHWTGSLAVVTSFYITELDRYSNGPPVMHAIRLTDAEYETAQRLSNVVLEDVVETDGYAGHLRVAVQDAATGETGSLWLSLGEE